MYKGFLVIIFFGFILSNLFGNNTISNKADSLIVALEQTENKIEKINILIDLAIYYARKDINLSEKYAKQALSYSVEENYNWGIAYSNYYLAKAFIYYDYDLTERFIIKSMELAKEMNDQLLLAKIYNLIGNLKDNNNLEAEALNYYEKSMLIYRELQCDSLISALYNNMAIIHSNQNNDSLAIVFYFKAIEINKHYNDYTGLAINYMNIGGSYLQYKQYDKAFSSFNQSLNLIKENSFNSLLPWIYNNISGYYYDIRNLDKSIVYANKAVHSSIEMINRTQEIVALSHLKDAYAAKDDYKKSFELSESILGKRDSLQTSNRLKEIDLLNLIYEHNEEMKLNELEHQNQRNIYWAIIITLILTIGLGVSLVYNQKEKIKKNRILRANLELEKKVLQQEAEVRSRELTKELLHSSEINILISDIIKRLADPGNRFIPENEKLISEIVVNLKRHKNSQVWEAFDQEFTQVHPRFFQQLSIDFPKLTQNDKRLCAFLKLNMNTKDISKISNLEVSSVEKSRTRLRKKLNLTGNHISLTAFLQTF